MMGSRRVSLRFTDAQFEGLEKMVEDGLYMTISEAIRDAVNNRLLRHKLGVGSV